MSIFLFQFLPFYFWLLLSFKTTCSHPPYFSLDLSIAERCRHRVHAFLEPLSRLTFFNLMESDMHNHTAFNWRATIAVNAAASTLPADVCDYLDLLTELLEDDGHYLYRTANRHTCAVDDPIVMLHHVRLERLCRTPDDHKLFDRAVNLVRAIKPAYFCDSEIERRMSEADGDCPMCGFRPSFHGVDHEGRRSMMTRCNHISNFSVEGDTDQFLRQARVWQGKNWPFSFMEGRKITCGENGKTILRHDAGAPCQGCLELEAIERNEQALFKLAEVGRSAEHQFARPGWSLPVSSICEGSADQMLMRVKNIIADSQDSFSDSKEVRLNGAGLKLYIKPVRSGMRLREIHCGMRVGGDQVNDYPGFQAFAHKLFEDMGVPTT